MGGSAIGTSVLRKGGATFKLKDFALRQPSYSMQGVAPIKLDECLLMNLPTIATKRIGLTEEILNHFEDCLLYNHSTDLSLQQSELMNWLERTNEIQEFHHYSRRSIELVFAFSWYGKIYQSNPSSYIK